MAKIKKSWDGNEQSFYHFTTLDAFFKIYESGKIRLSPCNSIKNAAVETMALYCSIKDMLSNDSELKDKLLGAYQTVQENELIDFLIQHRMQSYIACFSKFDENNENEEISKAEYLWKFYAEESKGVVIKFNYACYPFRNHSVQGVAVENSIETENIFCRSSQIRVDSVIYDNKENLNRLKKYIQMGSSFHPFATDIYKPKCCELENEIRMLAYLRNRQELSSLDGISEPSSTNSELPEYLDYDFKSKETKETGRSILKVYCRKEETRDELLKICVKDMVVYLNNSY